MEMLMETVSTTDDHSSLCKDDVIIEDTNVTQGNDVVVTSVIQCLSNIVDGYSKTHGTFFSWETVVNLDPPKSWKEPTPEGDKHLKDYWNSLQYTLYETDLPETVDRTSNTRALQNKEYVNVVFLSSPEKCIGILLEGGKQVPGGFHLVMSPSWLSKTSINEEGTLSKLWLHKSISFHENGTSFIDEYTPPRPVTYLANYFTNVVTGGHRNDGATIEKYIDCPMSSSIKLCEMAEDKFWTRDIMASAGMEIPMTLALGKGPKRKLFCGSSDLKYKDFSTFPSDNRMELEAEVMKFCDKLINNDIRKVVVKPSGHQFLGSIGASFHDVTDAMDVIDAAEALLVDIYDGCSVLIEEFIEPPTSFRSSSKETPLWVADEDLGFRVQAIVCRDYDNTIVTTLINCNIGKKNLPINGGNPVYQTLESTLLGYNIHDKSLIRDLESDIRVQSANVMKGIIDREMLLSAEEGCSFRGHTVVIGIDIIITDKSRKLKPVGIDVNVHDCSINTHAIDFMSNQYLKSSGHSSHHIYNAYQGIHSSKLMTSDQSTSGTILQSMSPLLDQDSQVKGIEIVSNENLGTPSRNGERKKNLQESRYHGGDAMGRSVRPLVRNMITRSQHYMMQGKRILIVGACSVSKMSIWPEAKRHGIEVILVDPDPNHPAKDEVYKMLHCDFNDHNQDFTHAREVYHQLQMLGEKVDGCLTFWEDCVPLAAILSEMMGTKGTSYNVALTVKKKSRTHIALSMRTGVILNGPRTFQYASPSFHLSTCDDIKSAVKRINFPAVLKLEHGSGAFVASMVNSEEELTKKYKHISKKLTSAKDFPAIGLGYDNSMVVMDFIGGSEHDIDIIMYDRKLVCAFISDDGPTTYPNFVATSGTMPSTLPEDKQAQLVAAVYQCCTEIGLSNGAFNVEMKMTNMGPKLIEINARMGGFYRRDWIRNVYGVDLMLCAMMISAGIKPYVPKHPPNGQLMGIMLVPSHHDHLFRDDSFFQAMKTMPNNYDIIFKPLPNSNLLDQYEQPFAHVTVKGSSVTDAKDKLKHVCKKLKIDNANYNVDGFLKHFSDRDEIMNS